MISGLLSFGFHPSKAFITDVFYSATRARCPPESQTYLGALPSGPPALGKLEHLRLHCTLRSFRPSSSWLGRAIAETGWAAAERPPNRAKPDARLGPAVAQLSSTTVRPSRKFGGRKLSKVQRGLGSCKLSQPEVRRAATPGLEYNKDSF